MSVFSTAVKLSFFILLAHSVAAQAAEVKFLGGAGFRSAMTQLAPLFEKTSGHKVVSSWDATGGIQKRVSSGEAFDVVFVGPEVVDGFIKDGKVVAGTRHEVARSGVGVAVRAGAPKPDISSPDKLKQALLNAKSVGYVGEGMSGAAFLDVLKRLQIADQMKSKLKRLEVAAIFTAASNGEADLIVYLVPPILGNKSVTLVGPLPEELQRYVVLATGLSSKAPQPDAAKALIAFLRSDNATKIIRASGW